MSLPAAVSDYLTDNSSRFVDELCDFLRIPSVSADSTRRPEMQLAAEFCRDQLTRIGFEARIVPTDGHPIVAAERPGPEGAPRVLVYGHYDVQPADPLELWETPPFEPTIREGRLFARGATDDKGQLFTHIKSAEAWLKAAGDLPVHLTFVIEGEEEVGSENLDRFLEQERERLRPDVAVISDTSQYGPGIPAITYGLRGITAGEVRVFGPNRDLHSGVFGGAVANPANAVGKLIASLHDNEGRVLIPGFYDDVAELTPAERTAFAELPFDESQFCEELGVSAPFGEPGRSTLERRWSRPTCDINGIFGGYSGEGPKTIVPAHAGFKYSCRLVPNQDPAKITASLRTYLESRCPPGIRVEFHDYHGCPGIVFAPDSPWMNAAKSAIAEGFGRPPVMIREGGSIPVAGAFRDILGVDTLLLGWGRNTDNLHSPNEHFHLADFANGTRASAALWEALAGRDQ